MSTHLLYVSGPPGAGKSTLLDRLTTGCEREPGATGIPHDVLRDPRRPGEVVALEMGVRRAQFSGTDALSMSIQPQASAWLAEHPARLVLGEGDRLANLKFLTAAEHAHVTVTLVNLAASDELLEQRWAERQHQDATWRAGRVSKARRLADQWETYGGTVITLDAALPTDSMIEIGRAHV